MPTVLLVDDAADNRMMYAEYLRAQHFRAIEIDNAADALALGSTADAVVVDIRLPGSFDGLELVRRLRSDGRTQNMPIVVLTACAFETDRIRAREAGCDAFLSKPCLPDTLVIELRRALAQRMRRHPARVGLNRRPRRGIA
jgi:CheY-like chemotaxis protein